MKSVHANKRNKTTVNHAFVYDDHYVPILPDMTWMRIA